MVMLAVYIDDLLVIGTTMSHVRSVRQQLSSVFCITDQGNFFLHIISMNIKYDHEAHTLSIDQSRYIKEILEKFSMSDAWTCHRNRPMGYGEATGGLVEKVSIVKGKVRTTGKVSCAKRGSKFSQEEDQAQEHVSQGRLHGQEWDNKGVHTVREGHQIGAKRMVMD
ncbi:uncharacterized protein UHO2_04073 [Ustilago hordei]|uniref:Reverse transcriptase Ty1/copia-type domain-containing protein n=1 Tax=Ustilago hordei TaxID=120017 RepID=I2FY94_USTHO|nr:uncharacterized protein UHO2_04073 [Ustilago hordei]CCF51887.1 uncharacterized protein UHOR_04965 [Ustilago hordei]SYW86576.1 uncharacterized protein UHO2_04073 [Ustilago hordei]